MPKYDLEDRDDLRGVLAEMYETMKRHESAILELIVEIESMRSTLTGSEAAKLQQMKQKILAQRSEVYATQLSLFDAIIEELRTI